MTSQRMRRFVGPALVVAALLLVGALLAVPAMTARGEVNAKDLAVLESLSRAFRAIAKEITPCTVHIRVKQKVEDGSGLPDDFFRMLPPEFRDRIQPKTEPGQPRYQQAQGSGVIVRADGVILTNYHVIKDADEITVFLADGKDYKATKLGADPKIDAAVIKIDAKDLPAAKLGDSDKADVGDWVVACGNPFGLAGTVTSGIISAKGRQDVAIPGIEYPDFLQTDAAINPGNSGGPMVNVQGQVIGINTAIASRVGGYQGIGFAVPINMIKEELEDLIAGKEIVRGYLGVAIQDLDEGLAKSLGLPDQKGAIVTQVAPKSPAENAGLKVQDVVRTLDGKPVEDTKHLRNAVARIRPDTTVTLGIVRGGKAETLKLTIGRQPEDMMAAFGGVGPGGTLQSGQFKDEVLGITVETLDKEAADKLGVSVGDGVRIAKIEQGSPVLDRDMAVGDLIERVGDSAVGSAAEYAAAMKNQKLADGIRLLVRTEDGGKRFVFVQRK